MIALGSALGSARADSTPLCRAAVAEAKAAVSNPVTAERTAAA